MLESSGKRVLLLGAETELGRAIASALAEAGARLALVGATNDAETAFAVQRLARKLAAEAAQAIDATNEMAVRVMVRQVSKTLGGLDTVVFAPGSREDPRLTFEQSRHLLRSGGKELERRGGGRLVQVVHGGGYYGEMYDVEPPYERIYLFTEDRPPDYVARDVVAALAAPARNR